jgi:predicted transcriptional regulator
MYPEPMQTVKEQVMHVLQRLPDDADFRDVNEEIALLAAVAEAEADIREGRLVENNEMKARLDEWLDA